MPASSWARPPQKIAIPTTTFGWVTSRVLRLYNDKIKVVEAKENKPLCTLVRTKTNDVQGNSYRGPASAILEVRMGFWAVDFSISEPFWSFWSLADMMVCGRQERKSWLRTMCFILALLCLVAYGRELSEHLVIPIWLIYSRQTPQPSIPNLVSWSLSMPLCRCRYLIYLLESY